MLFMTAIDLSGDIGLLAVFLLTLNILVGLLIAVRFDPRRTWFGWHNVTGYVALAVSALHPLPLLFAARARFSLGQILWPIHAPSQAWENTIGAVALYGVALVVVTSYYRLTFGRKLWKRVHYFSYLGAALFFTHSLLLDPELRGQPFQPLDAEKVSVEICVLLVLVASLARWRYARRHPRRRYAPVPYTPGFAETPAALAAEAGDAALGRSAR